MEFSHVSLGYYAGVLVVAYPKVRAGRLVELKASRVGFPDGYRMEEI